MLPPHFNSLHAGDSLYSYSIEVNRDIYDPMLSLKNIMETRAGHTPGWQWRQILQVLSAASLVSQMLSRNVLIAAWGT
jgi:hypothetical protein